MNIPVIINNRDLLTWPKAMVEKISGYDGVGEIIIVDNGSTYPPLLEWYDTNPCKIYRCENLGHGGAWVSGAVQEANSEFYVVTDSDIGLENTPSDTLMYLFEKMNSLDLDKLGLGLDWQIVPPDAFYYNRLNLYEKDRWLKSEVREDVYLDVQIDTTFAMYRVEHYFIGGASTYKPYVARHYPWEFSKETYEANEEFKYYIEHASHSCSFKTLLNL